MNRYIAGAGAAAAVLAGALLIGPNVAHSASLNAGGAGFRAASAPAAHTVFRAVSAVRVVRTTAAHVARARTGHSMQVHTSLTAGRTYNAVLGRARYGTAGHTRLGYSMNARYGASGTTHHCPNMGTTSTSGK